MSHKKHAEQRAEMPRGSAPILENRSIAKDYRTILPLLRPGLKVLDVGCGTGTMTADMAHAVGPSGLAHGLDNSEHLIQRGRGLYSNIPNLELICGDIFGYKTKSDYDLITAARLLQWLENPQGAIRALIGLLRPGGTLSVLDYDHTDILFDPEPPDSMKYFYQRFLDWRSDAGMNNSIANELAQYFENEGLEEIKSFNADQAYYRGQEDFFFKIGIWSDVAASRGKQLVEDGYLDDSSRLLAIKEYSEWVKNEARSMVLKLKEVRGLKS